MITNNTGVSLAMAVWLVNDDYDYQKAKPNYISVTTLLKPLRQIVLPRRVEEKDRIDLTCSTIVLVHWATRSTILWRRPGSRTIKEPEKARISQ